jgi:hypothetical protein
MSQQLLQLGKATAYRPLDRFEDRCLNISITLKARSVLRLSITAPKRLNIPNCSNVSLTRDYAKWVNGRQDRLDKLVRDYWD